MYLYYPDEGFGTIYRRVMLNDFFTKLLDQAKIQTVAEIPVDPYGIIGAGSLIFTRMGATVTLISEDMNVLRRARALMEFNCASEVCYLQSLVYRIPVPDNRFDFTWNFDVLLTLTDQKKFLRELCRVSKATLVVIPNACSYGQYLHHIYHLITNTTCMHAGPRSWMKTAPNGMTIIAEGIIDVPWWPSFPELPNMVRRLLGHSPVGVDGHGIPEANPRVVQPEELPSMYSAVARSAFIERGCLWPRPVKQVFAHNLYVMGCKPEHRQALGL